MVAGAASPLGGVGPQLVVGFAWLFFVSPGPPGEYIMVLGGVGVLPNASAGTDGTTGFDFGIGRIDTVRRD